MPQAKPFLETGYSKKEEKAILQTLKPYLKPDANPERILSEISTMMVDLCEEASIPGAVAYRPTIEAQQNALIIALTNARDSLEALGERYQWHLDYQHCPGHSFDLLETLNAALTAAQLAATRPNPHLHIQETGTARNHAMRHAVTSLLEIFEKATGIKPTFYSDPHAKDGYKGSCYEFLVACLGPVRLVAPKTLRSNILLEYKQWNRVLEADDLDMDRVTTVTIQSVEYRKEQWSLRFDEVQGRFPLDQSNFGAVCALYRDDLDEWIGKKIALCPDPSVGIQIQGPILKSTKYPPAA